MTIECDKYRTEVAPEPEKHARRTLRYLRYNVRGNLQLVLGQEVDPQTQMTEITTITLDNTRLLEQLFERAKFIPTIEITDMGTIRTDKSVWSTFESIVESMDRTLPAVNMSSHGILFLSMQVSDHAIGPVAFGLGKTPSREI